MALLLVLVEMKMALVVLLPALGVLRQLRVRVLLIADSLLMRLLAMPRAEIGRLLTPTQHA